MNLSDLSGRPTGSFYLEIHRSGDLADVVQESNLVVASSRIILASLLGGGLGAITKFGVGINGAAPALTDTALGNPTYAAINGVSFPSPGEVKFAFSLGSLVGNGKAISEFGLLSAANVLFARKVRPVALAKTPEISLIGFWTINF
jgi:hypothetical protein